MGTGRADSIPRMPVDTPETRTLIHLRTGSKVCVLVAICLVAAAVYFYFVPVSVRTSSGGVFECGSAIHPPTSNFQQNVCSGITHVNLYRAILFAAMGVLVAALGCWFFGVDRTIEERIDRFSEDEEAAEPAGPAREERRSRSRRAPKEPTRAARHVDEDSGEGDPDDEDWDDEDWDDEDGAEVPPTRTRARSRARRVAPRDDR